MDTRIDPTKSHDAILIVSFGGPEQREDVMPFLENVTRGRNIPRERLLEVAKHYDHFGGVSPINAHVRDLIAALRPELDRREIQLPIFWGNRNWHPMLTDTLRAMTEQGLDRALGVVLAAFSSYSSCRQYREDIKQARRSAGPPAPRVDKVRVFYNHPAFIAANAERVREAFTRVPADRRDRAYLVFTAHSIPMVMASGCEYEAQLQESCRLVAERLGISPERWALAYQSRSGRPQDPWLEPDILEYLQGLHDKGVVEVVIHPIGFLSDHIEVLYDLDEEASQACARLGLTMQRSATVGTHPEFISLLGELIEERLAGRLPRRAIGRFGASHDVCPADCCPPQVPPYPVS